MEKRMEPRSCSQGPRARVLLVASGKMNPPSWVPDLPVSPCQRATQPQRVRLGPPSQVAELMCVSWEPLPACKSHWDCRESQPHLLQWSGLGGPLGLRLQLHLTLLSDVRASVEPPFCLCVPL